MRVPVDIFCAIDLDTILPVYKASQLRRKKRVYDAHELFTELKEVIIRPRIHALWKRIAQHTVPNFSVGYTIGECYAEELERRYGVHYVIVRNATVLKDLQIPPKPERFILYQGAVNVGRCFEQLIPAMKSVNARLIICGAGNFFEEAQAICRAHHLEEKVIFKGYVPPEELRRYTLEAWAGITLFEDTSLSNRLSLANRFFDYMHSGVPQLCIKYPEYERVNEQYEIASLIDDTSPESIAAALNRLLQDDAYYGRLQQNCLEARKKYCWQEETKTLLKTYGDLAGQ